MFIIVDALERVDSDIQGEERLVIAMKHIGGSITMTTSTDLVAFAVSTVSDFPAVHLFCTYAAFSIFFTYVMLITLFVALLTWDIHRIENGKRDICPCRKPIEQGETTVNPWLKEKEDFSKTVRCLLSNFNCFFVELFGLLEDKVIHKEEFTTNLGFRVRKVNDTLGVKG